MSLHSVLYLAVGHSFHRTNDENILILYRMGVNMQQFEAVESEGVLTKRSQLGPTILSLSSVVVKQDVM